MPSGHVLRPTQSVAPAVWRWQDGPGTVDLDEVAKKLETANVSPSKATSKGPTDMASPRGGPSLKRQMTRRVSGKDVVVAPLENGFKVEDITDQ